MVFDTNQAHTRFCVSKFSNFSRVRVIKSDKKLISHLILEPLFVFSLPVLIVCQKVIKFYEGFQLLGIVNQRAIDVNAEPIHLEVVDHPV